MAEIYRAATAKIPRVKRPSTRDANIAELANLADALLAEGRGDLAQRLIEVLYYCAERQIENDNVIALADRRRARDCRSGSP